MTKKYKLIKDYPDVKAGTIFTDRTNLAGFFSGVYETSGIGNYYGFPARVVENNPEWFEEVVEEEEPLDLRIEKDSNIKDGSFVRTRTTKATTTFRQLKELEARCALTREEIEELIEALDWANSDENVVKDVPTMQSKLQAILDAMGGE